MTSHLIAVAMLSLAIGSAGFMLGLSKITLRLRMGLAFRGKNSRFFRWLSELAKCPYCSGTWMSLVAVALYRPYVTHLWQPLDYLITVFAVSGLAMLPVWWIRKALS